jgi:hypothetical protein
MSASAGINARIERYFADIVRIEAFARALWQDKTGTGSLRYLIFKRDPAPMTHGTEVWTVFFSPGTAGSVTAIVAKPPFKREGGDPELVQVESLAEQREALDHLLRIIARVKAGEKFDGVIGVQVDHSTTSVVAKAVAAAKERVASTTDTRNAELEEFLREFVPHETLFDVDLAPAGRLPRPDSGGSVVVDGAQDENEIFVAFHMLALDILSGIPQPQDPSAVIPSADVYALYEMLEEPTVILAARWFENGQVCALAFGGGFEFEKQAPGRWAVLVRPFMQDFLSGALHGVRLLEPQEGFARLSAALHEYARPDEEFHAPTVPLMGEANPATLARLRLLEALMMNEAGRFVPEADGPAQREIDEDEVDFGELVELALYASPPLLWTQALERARAARIEVLVTSAYPGVTVLIQIDQDDEDGEVLVHMTPLVAVEHKKALALVEDLARDRAIGSAAPKPLSKSGPWRRLRGNNALERVRATWDWIEKGKHEGCVHRILAGADPVELAASAEAALPQLAVELPDPIFTLSPQERHQRALLTSEYCLLHTGTVLRAFVRGIFPVPIKAVDTDFALGVWAEVTEATLAHLIPNALGLKPAPVRSDGASAPLKGVIASRVPGPDIRDLAVEIRVHRDPGKRPSFYICDRAHPLHVVQAEGIDLTGARENGWVGR